jgi:hypothetical protein
VENQRRILLCVEKGSSWIGSDGGGRHACGVCDCRGD